MDARKARGTATLRVRTTFERPGLGRMARPKIMCLFAFLVFAVTSSLLGFPRQDVRVLQVKAVIDTELEGEEIPEARVARWLCAASRVFNKAFGLRFSIKRFAYWSPPAARLPLSRLMEKFLGEVSPEDAEIVVGLISADRVDSQSAGVASYARGALLVKELESDRLMTLVLVHELCHLFGAVELKSRGSVMSAKKTRLGFDAFTAKVVSLHRSRAFGGPDPGLSDRDFSDALLAYRERAALNLGEVELNLLLARLCLEACDRAVPLSAEAMGGKPYPAVDWASEAVRCCEKALACRPEYATAHHFLGVALARGGNLAQAQACFDKAVALDAGYASRR